jgi:hypothetical protein
MWTIPNLHLEIVSRPRPPILTSQNRIFTTSPGRRNWVYRSRIALKIDEHVHANTFYSVVKVYANPRLEKRNYFLTVGPDPDRLPQIKPLRSSVWHEI